MSTVNHGRHFVTDPDDDENNRALIAEAYEGYGFTVMVGRGGAVIHLGADDARNLALWILNNEAIDG